MNKWASVRQFIARDHVPLHNPETKRRDSTLQLRLSGHLVRERSLQRWDQRFAGSYRLIQSKPHNRLLLSGIQTVKIRS